MNNPLARMHPHPHRRPDTGARAHALLAHAHDSVVPPPALWTMGLRELWCALAWPGASTPPSGAPTDRVTLQKNGVVGASATSDAEACAQ